MQDQQTSIDTCAVAVTSATEVHLRGEKRRDRERRDREGRVRRGGKRGTGKEGRRERRRKGRELSSSVATIIHFPD